jgi:tetratricopeptide (TPR) repeat protein
MESRAGHLVDRMRRDHYAFLASVILILLSGITFMHLDVFANRLSFWQDAAEHSPHLALAQRNLGAMYYLDQNYVLAEVYSKKALDLNPKEPMAHNNLGLIYASRGEVEKAKAEYEAELSFNPRYDSAHYNFGLLYYQMGDFANARKEWEETLRVNQNYTDALRALQSLYPEGMWH